jgi:hypothetical protein
MYCGNRTIVVVYVYIGLCIICIHISEIGTDLVCEDVLRIPLQHPCTDGRTPAPYSTQHAMLQQQHATSRYSSSALQQQLQQRMPPQHAREMHRGAIACAEVTTGAYVRSEGPVQ